MGAKLRCITLDDLQHLSTLSTEEAARLVGISRSHAYALVAKEQFFETIQIGKTRRVLAKPLYRVLAGTAA